MSEMTKNVFVRDLPGGKRLFRSRIVGEKDNIRVRLYLDKSQVFFSTVMNIPIDHLSAYEDSLLRGCAPSELSFYYNGMLENVEITNRIGIPNLLSHSTTIDFRDKVVVRKVILLSSYDAIQAACSYVLALGKDELISAELKLIKETLLTQAYSTGNKHRFVVDYVVNGSDLRELGSFYDPSSDLVFSIKDRPEKIKHPFCSQTSRENGVKEFPSSLQDNDDIACVIRYVNNEESATTYYTKAFGKVITLRPQKGLGARCSNIHSHAEQLNVYVEVYETSNSDKTAETKDQKFNPPRIFSLEQAKQEFGLFDSYEVAMSDGHPEQVSIARKKIRDQDDQRLREEEDARIKRQREEEDASAKRQRAEEDAKHKRRLTEETEQHARAMAEKQREAEERQALLRSAVEARLSEDKAELERKQKRLKDDQDLLIARQLADQKIKTESVKHHYEVQSADRKDSSEIIKIVGGTIVATLAVVTAVAKIFGSK
jgi:flagellar biosynthesis GTPase FlhF